MSVNRSHTTETKKNAFDINKVDYDWVEKTNNLKELKRAYSALEEDGYFPDLMKTVGDKIAGFDPAFKKKLEGETKMSAEELKQVNDDLYSFL